MYFLTIAKKTICSHIRPLLPRLFSSPAAHNPDLKKTPFMVVDYLISTFGIAPAKAATISKRISHLKSPLNPDAITSFLNAQGFSQAEIKTIIIARPNILCSSLQNCIAPNFRALSDMGLPASTLKQIILSGPEALHVRSAVPTINFWKDFVGGDEMTLVKVIKRNRGLLGHDINRGIAAKMTLLQSHGISTNDIRRILCQVPSFIATSLRSMEDLLKRAKELGIQPQSGMLVHGLVAMSSATKEALHKKLELLKSFGWSEEQVLSAVQKTPTILCLSEENWQVKMDFLREQVGLDNSYISFHPVLLTFCLEQRLKPRHNVLRILQSKELLRKRINFHTAIKISNNDFMAKYINPNMEEIPELHEVYLAACASGTK